MHHFLHIHFHWCVISRGKRDTFTCNIYFLKLFIIKHVFARMSETRSSVISFFANTLALLPHLLWFLSCQAQGNGYSSWQIFCIIDDLDLFLQNQFEDWSRWQRSMEHILLIVMLAGGTHGKITVSTHTRICTHTHSLTHKAKQMNRVVVWLVSSYLHVV